MAKRKIITIDAAKCNGCGLCIPNCPEGAIQIIDGKARLISDLFCDGLGACIGHCPQGAITIEEREAEEYNEKKVMDNIVRQGRNVILAHLEHLKEHKQNAYLKQALDYLKERGIEVPDSQGATMHKGSHAQGCPSQAAIHLARKQEVSHSTQMPSQLQNWPVQLKLIPPVAPFLNEADLLIAADCVPFVYADFHQDLLKGKILLVGCPKLDDTNIYKEKISQIIKYNNIKSISYAHMEVPCCFGLVSIIKSAISESRKNIPFNEVVIGIKGDRLQ